MKRIVVRAPSSGLDYRVEPPFLINTAAADIRNMRVLPTYVAKRTGTVPLGVNLPLDKAVTHIDQFYEFNGSQWLLAFTAGKVYMYDAVGNTWVDISRAGGYGESYYWSVDIMNDVLVCTNGVDAVQMWDGTGTLQDLPFTSKRCKFVRKFKNTLMFLFVVEGDSFPQVVAWPVPGTLYNWSGTGAGATELSSGVDWIVGGELLGDFLIIYKERSLVAASYVGGTVVFRFDTAISGVGMVGPRAGINLGDEHVFLGWDNVYVYGGGRSLTTIGDAVKKEMFTICTASALHKSIGAMLEEDDEFWFIIPSYGSDVPNVAWVYNYQDKKWARHDIEATSFGYWQAEAAHTFGSAAGTFGTASGRFGDRAYTSTVPSALLGQQNGNVLHYNKLAMSDNGAVIPCTFATRAFLGEENGDDAVNKRWLKVVLEARGHHVKLEYRPDGGDWIAAGTATLGLGWERYEFSIDVLARALQLRFSNSEVNSTLELRSFELEYEPQGVR